MRRPAAIGHLDADAFYCNCERVRFAHLRGRPVGVLGNQGACVIARSYEMRAKGIRVGEPIWDAKRLCPEGVYIKRDFKWYEVVSRRLLDVVREFSPAVEYYSIDEFFFEAVPLGGLTLQQTAEALRDRVGQVVGVPVTVGIGRSKTLAKLIAERAKPAGALALTDRDAERLLLDQTPTDAIAGIASRRAAKLADHGVFTALDLALADRRRIRDLLTVVGEAIWYELNGDPVTPLYTERPPHKILSRGGSVGKPTADPDYLHGWLARSAERLVEELEHYRVRTGRLEVWAETVSGRHGCGRTDLAAPTDRFDHVMAAARDGFFRLWVSGEKVARVQLVATRLCWPGSYQQGLFEQPAAEAEKLAELKRTINSRVGRFALRSGLTLFLGDELYRDVSHSYEVCDVRGKMCF